MRPQQHRGSEEPWATSKEPYEATAQALRLQRGGCIPPLETRPAGLRPGLPSGGSPAVARTNYVLHLNPEARPAGLPSEGPQ